MTFEMWLAYGREREWVSSGVCSTHDGLPLSDEEEAEFDEGHDPCVPVLRVWTENITDDAVPCEETTDG